MNVSLKIMTRKKVDAFSPTEKWNPRTVVDWILACRADEGIPMFKTGYAGLKFAVANKPAVLGICWGGRNTAPSVLFTHVPHDDLELIEEGIGDWRKLIDKYGSEKEKREALKYGIYLKGFKLPRFG